MQILLNWLWQGTALALLVAFGMRARRRINAATRERVWAMTLVAVAAMPLAHATTLAGGGSRVVSAVAIPIAPDAPIAPLLVRLPSDAWLVLIAALWAAWTIFSIARLMVALLHLRTARTRALPFAADRELRLRAWTAVRARGRRARLVVSADVHRAAVLGLGHPLIAVSPETISRLSDEELDQVVIHEYAHIQRHDDFAVVVQRLISAIVGLHPAIWWLDRTLTTEREVACDDWVVAHTGTAARYAACLVRLASPSAERQWSVMPGAALSRPQLTIRVTRLLDRGRDTSVARSTASLCAALPLVASLALACVATPLVQVDVAPPGPTRVGQRSGAEIRGLAAPLDPVAPSSARAPVRQTTAEAVSPRRSAPRATRRIAAAAPTSRARHAAAGSTASSPAAAPREETTQDSERGAIDPVFDPLPAASLPLAFANDRGKPGAGEVAPLQQSPWKAPANAGVAIGSLSREAAVRTAGFFSRLGRSVASSF